MEEIARTQEIGKKAFSQIRSLNTSAIPRYYELWYTYASGHNSGLNRQINSLIDKNGTITREDHDALFETFLSQTALTEQTEIIGGQISGQLSEVLAKLTDGIGETSKFSESLAGAQTELRSASDEKDVMQIVSALVDATKKMDGQNLALEEQLTASREKIDELNSSLEMVRSESLTDALTSLGNRKNFDIAMSKEIEAAKTGTESFSLLVADVDHFKKFNDTYGHQTGDQVLRLVGMVLKQNVKGRDIPCRYGGEEFAIVLPDTNLPQAAKVAESVRIAIMNKELIKKTTGENLGRITVSLGVAQYKVGDDAATMVERADAALYAAKNRGRNQVVLETDLTQDQLADGH